MLLNPSLKAKFKTMNCNEKFDNLKDEIAFGKRFKLKKYLDVSEGSD